MEKKELGMKLRELREEKGYSQHILAEKAHIGNIYLGEIERGQKMPSTAGFLKLVAALDIPADRILCNALPDNKYQVYNDMAQTLDALDQNQRQAVLDIINAYIDNLK